MKLLLFGATGMVGQGVLRECLLDPTVEGIVTVGRTATGAQHPKLQEIVRQDLWSYADVAPALSGFQACFFCLGVSSAGMTERDYERITYGITLAVAERLFRLNPHVVFVYVSGVGTDSSEQGRSMWVRGRKMHCCDSRSRRRTCFAPDSSCPCTVRNRRRRSTGCSTH